MKRAGLTREEEIELAPLARAGDKKARDRMVLANTGLVGEIIKKRFRSFLPSYYEDLFQEGIVGLIQAVDGYDETRDIRFSTYAQWWIGAMCMNYVSKNAHGQINLATSPKARLVLIRSAKVRELWRAGATPKQIAKALELDTAVLEMLLPRLMGSIRDLAMDSQATMRNGHREEIRETMGERSRFGVAETEDPIETIGGEEEREIAARAMLRLPPRERDVVIDSMAGRSLASSARRYGLSRERMRQLRNKGIARMKKAIGT